MPRTLLRGRPRESAPDPADDARPATERDDGDPVLVAHREDGGDLPGDPGSTTASGAPEASPARSRTRSG